MNNKRDLLIHYSQWLQEKGIEPYCSSCVDAYLRENAGILGKTFHCEKYEFGRKITRCEKQCDSCN